MTPKKTKTFYAWAINTNFPHRPLELIGRYWQFGTDRKPIPVHMEGCRFAMFKTRQEARDALHWVKKQYGYPSARVVHVKVSVELLLP